MAAGERVAFEDCSLRAADLYAAKLAGTAFERCDLTALACSQADLAGARLQGSTLADIEGAAALKGVSIASDQIVALALLLFGSLGITIDDEVSG